MTFWALTISAGVLVVLLAFFLASKPTLTSRGDKLKGLIVLGVLPALWLTAMNVNIFVGSMRMDFCGQCHTMQKYVDSLQVEDDDALASSHYLNNRVPRETACYSCHANHEPIVGPVLTKIKGLKEAYVEYVVGAPEKIEPKAAYVQESCLLCHKGAKNFEEAHEDDMADILAKKITCKDCHDVGHVFKKAEGN